MKKILVIDDDANILEVVQFVLEDEGYEVETSVNGAGLQQMNGELPDLILLDILLSGEDGREICQLLKGKELTRHIPVILFSAHFNARKITAMHGADAFLSKPFHLNELISLVKRFI